MLAIIPARGGSKGLPGKNIRPFNGKPLIAYTIEAALSCEKIERVIVSTDDEDIARVSMEHGAEVPFMRPNALASDDSAAIDTFFYTVEELNRREERLYDAFIVLYPTAPLRTVEHITEAIEIFECRKASSVISVTESDHPIEWTRVISNDILRPYFDDGNRNRQDYKATFFPNGQLYIFDYNALKASRSFYMEDTYPYVTDKKYYADIDDLMDFQLAEFKHQLLNKS